MPFATEVNKEKNKTIIRNAFPKTLTKDVDAVLNIIPLDVHTIKLIDGQIHLVKNLIHPTKQILFLNQEQLEIPYRIYFNEPEEKNETSLNNIQKTILHCIYLRHHNGHIRQQHLEKLIDKKEQWIIPFTLPLLGEYVYEILQVLEKHINATTINLYAHFIKENTTYWVQTEGRMISYWNEKHRQKFPNLKNYLGRQLVDRLKKPYSYEIR